MMGNIYSLSVLQIQDKQIILCKVLLHIRIIEGNEDSDKAAKQAIDMPGMTQKNYLIQTIT